MRPLRIAPDIHGETGLDGPALPKPTVQAVPEDAVTLVRQVLADSPDPVTICATGALTNVALLLQEHPDVAADLREVVWMGGSTGRGNISPYAEANAANDPEALEQVLASGVPFTMVGLDVTHEALVTAEVVQQLRDVGTPLAQLCVELMTFFAGTYAEAFGMPDPPLHDPVAVARIIDPALVPVVRANLVVETAGTWTSGATVVDLDGYTGRKPNASIATGLDAEAFFQLLVAAVAAYG